MRKPLSGQNPLLTLHSTRLTTDARLRNRFGLPFRSNSCRTKPLPWPISSPGQILVNPIFSPIMHPCGGQYTWGVPGLLYVFN